MGSELGVQANARPEPLLGSVGVFWACWAAVWTALLAAGMAFLALHRRVPMLRIRGLGLSLAAVTLLHLYWMSVQMGYVLGPVTPADGEFWIMGVYLPCGVALFHASNSRFLHVARAQKKYAQHGGRLVPGPPAASLRGRFRRLDYTRKIVIVVGLGMLCQLLLTVFMYLISRKWHPSWGIPGTDIHGTEMERKMEQGRGWEWWPSIFWQFFWAWVVAPIILWKARRIHDTQGWRVQTLACALVNLHAAPMWLVALYVPAMEPVNRYFIPPQWIAISIIMTEIFTVFLPCWEVARHHSLRQETLNSIAQWESKNTVSKSGVRSLHSASTKVESIMSAWKAGCSSFKSNDSGESILNMSALEHVLERNPAPLQEYAALRDFSGENIAFLTSVAAWRQSQSQRPPARDSAASGPRHHLQQDVPWVRERFSRALSIYAAFISPRHADFPINISSQDLRKLESTFASATRCLYGDKSEADPATPFDVGGVSLMPPWSSSSSSEGGSERALATAATGAADCAIMDVVQYWGAIPDAFDETVFDDAEKSIKYLVLTNTWPKFVRDRRASMNAFDAMEAGNDVVPMTR